MHAGRYVAVVDVELIETDDEWPPSLNVEDAAKLDNVREALEKEDVETASKYDLIFRLEAVST